MSLQRAFVFLNYRDYTAALHVAVSLTNRGIKSLLAVFSPVWETAQLSAWVSTPVPGVRIFSTLLPVWTAPLQGCPLPYSKQRPLQCEERGCQRSFSSSSLWAVLRHYFSSSRMIIISSSVYYSVLRVTRHPYSLFCRNPSQWYPESISLSKCVWHLALFTQKWQYLVPEVLLMGVRVSVPFSKQAQNTTWVDVKQLIAVRFQICN